MGMMKETTINHNLFPNKVNLSTTGKIEVDYKSSTNHSPKQIRCYVTQATSKTMEENAKTHKIFLNQIGHSTIQVSLDK
jgi:hypothetical protein